MILPFGQFDGQVRVKGVEDNDEEAVGHRAHQHDSQRDERVFDLRPNAIASVRDASERATVQDLLLPGLCFGGSFDSTQFTFDHAPSRSSS